MTKEDLARLRDDAIAKDMCFTKGRLRDEFRMKPAPGVEPVKYYKNTFGGRYGVYRIADCVPMRDRQPQSEAQRRAGHRQSVLARLKSESGRHALTAQSWMDDDPVFLDTEATGLGNSAQAIEIALSDSAGQVILETRLNPSVPVEPGATAVHGIDNSALAGSPEWPEVVGALRDAIGHRPVIIFNADYDMRILKQTAAAFGDTAAWLETINVRCAMRLAAGFWGATNRYGTISLATCVEHAQLKWAGKAHSAASDAVMTAGVVRVIAAKYLRLRQELDSYSR